MSEAVHEPVQARPVAGPGSHLVVVESVYHQPADGQPIVAESRFSRRLRTDEQPYVRWFKVTEEWQSLDHGWLDAAGMLVLKNEEGTNPQTIPSAEERAEIAAKVAEIGLLANDTLVLLFALLQPGESLRFQPIGIPALVVRCRKGEARCCLHLFPG